MEMVKGGREVFGQNRLFFVFIFGDLDAGGQRWIIRCRGGVVIVRWRRVFPRYLHGCFSEIAAWRVNFVWLKLSIDLVLKWLKLSTNL